MTNPWVHIPPTPPYVLDCDAASLLAFNRKARPEYRVELNLLPDPYIGLPDSPVMLLALNPGFAPADLRTHQDTAFRERCLANLHQRQQRYPFYYLDPKLPGGGRTYWEAKLRQPIRDFDRQRVARSVACVQYFPYHSQSYGGSLGQIPSQQYTFEMV